MTIGNHHGVCKKGFQLAIISTTREKETIEEDLKVAMDIIGEVKYKFIMEEVIYKAKDFSD